MNERILELAEQAGIEFDDDFPLEPEPIYLTTLSEFEKFAELIVRECAEVAHNRQYKHSPAHTVGDCAQAIKEHFGVEE